MRGKAYASPPLAKILGSPPPMRGKVPRSSVILDCVRITPAYAGKSLCHLLILFLEKDHPRLCGEKLSNRLDKRCVAGSPPPMRGKAHALTPLKIYGRITPAYAGKSLKFLSMIGW